MRNRPAPVRKAETGRFSRPAGAFSSGKAAAAPAAAGLNLSWDRLYRVA